MKIVKAYKYRLKTDENIENVLSEYCGSARFVWNKLFAINLARVKYRLPIIRYNEAAAWLSMWKEVKEYAFLKEAPSQVLQQKLKDLNKAFRDCFDKKQTNKKMPKWRKKGIHDSIRFPEKSSIKINDNTICLPKIGKIGYYNSRAIQGEIRNATISKQNGHWYIAIQTECEQEVRHANNNEVGIDVGITSLMTLSDGRCIAPANAYKNKKQKLAALQRKMSKKKRGSQNRDKVRRKIARLHKKVADTRRDYMHKLTTQISKNHAVIYVEKLDVKNMSKSARGTVEEPGKRVKVKSRLNTAILDQGWSEIKRQLIYKAIYGGGKVVEVEAKYTSQTCNICKHVAKESRIKEIFRCIKCDYYDHADVNAAKNIMAVGQTVTVCGGSVDISISIPVKQKPESKAI